MSKDTSTKDTSSKDTYKDRCAVSAEVDCEQSWAAISQICPYLMLYPIYVLTGARFPQR